MNKLLTDTKIYYLTDKNLLENYKDFNAEKYMNIEGNLWGSQFFDSGKKINFIDYAKDFNLKEEEYQGITIEHLDDLFFRNSEYHNSKGILYFKSPKDKTDPNLKIEVDVLFSPAAIDYALVFKSWIFSNVFRNELGINTDLAVKNL